MFHKRRHSGFDLANGWANEWVVFKIPIARLKALRGDANLILKL
jgi:hypothetical protein